ncbi:hypothetical protein LOAG_02979 [Loa loa]|uniref:Uncharacterized protein n=1 Tax=Loa loa TaxID=7209 RepID=A0A1S0U5Y6_LOALO|nr:hypothetical protein LOAG_02979 [Loa loa]EFO25504.1 hypothetical protein LOAG_02979 [Loa loa]
MLWMLEILEYWKKVNKFGMRSHCLQGGKEHNDIIWMLVNSGQEDEEDIMEEIPIGYPKIHDMECMSLKPFATAITPAGGF